MRDVCTTRFAFLFASLSLALAATATAETSWTQADSSPQAETHKDAESTPVEPVLFDPPDSARWVKTVAYDADVAPTKPAQTTTAPASAEPSFAKQLAMLEVKLARRITEQPNLWRFEDIEGEAAKLLSAAKNDAEQESVRDLINRVSRFNTLAGRYRQLHGGAPTTIASTSITSIAAVPASQAAPAYDAVGELRPVVSKRPGAPKYALVGGDGKIVTFITPAADLDLDPLLGKKVGARGGRGFMPEYKHRHLTAQKITPIETLRR